MKKLISSVLCVFLTSAAMAQTKMLSRLTFLVQRFTPMELPMST